MIVLALIFGMVINLVPIFPIDGDRFTWEPDALDSEGTTSKTSENAAMVETIFSKVSEDDD